MANVSPDNVPFQTEESATVVQIVTASDEGMVGRRIAFIMLGLVSAFCLATFERRRLQVRGWLGVLMLVFFCWSVMSLGWAEDTSLALRKVLIFVLLWLGAAWTASRLSAMNLLRFGFISNILTLLTCLAIEIGFGRFRPWVGSFRFAGLYHPNETGQCLLVATVAGCALASLSGRFVSSVGYIAAACISFAFLLLTGSRTALLSTLVALAVYWIVIACANPRALRALLICGAAGVFVAGLGYLLVGPDLVTHAGTALQLNRADSDVSTLTGRTPLWHALIGHYISARPWLGYGYGSFWSTKHIVAMSLLQKGTVYFHSHSGYLEMALGIGIVGAVVHVLTLLLGVKGLFAEYRWTGNQGSAFGSALLITLLVSMFTEPTNMSSYLMPTFLDMAFLMRCAFIRPDDVPAGVRWAAPAAAWARPQWAPSL